MVKPGGESCPHSQSICLVPGMKTQCCFSTNQSNIQANQNAIYSCSLGVHVLYNLQSAKFMSDLYMYQMVSNATKLIDVVPCHTTISTITFTSTNIANFQDTSQNFCQLCLCDEPITLQVHNKCSKKSKPLTHKAPVITKSIKTYIHCKVKLRLEQL